MSIKIGTLKKIQATETYAVTPLEVQAWAKGLADLRIEFGKERAFKLSPRSLNRPKIEGIVPATLLIDAQLKPAIFFYPLPKSKYPEAVATVFKKEVFCELRNWLDQQLAKDPNEMVGTDLIVVAMEGSQYKLHRVKYL